MTEHHKPTPTTFWEERYAASDRVWSGRVNEVLASIASPLEPGRALDLGCGEGGDVIWLAQRGWHATGIDISTTAIARARQAAAALELTDDQVRFEATNLAHWRGDSTYDLVTASFLQSPVELPRAEILRSAAARVSPSGHLLITSHAAPPPWASTLHRHAAEFQTPDEELDALRLAPDAWTTVLAETRTRDATGPDGRHAELIDSVVLLRRR